MYAILRTGAFFCACLYLLFSALAFCYGSIDYRTAAVAVGGMVFLAMLFISIAKRGLSFCALMFLPFCFFIVSLFNYEWSGYRSVFTVFVFISALGVSWFAVEFKKTVILFELPFIIFLIVTLWLVLAENYGAAEFNTILVGSSRNVYSGILLALASGYIFSREYTGKTISVTLLFLVFLVSFPLYSRNGMFVSFLLFFCVLYRRSPLTAGGGALAAFAALIFGWDFFYEFIQARTNLSAGIESDRYYIAQDYFAHLDLVSFFSGIDLTTVPMVESFGGNPHSAFLRLHSFFGFSVFLLLVVASLSFCALVLERKFLLVVVFLLYVFRAAFDIFYLFNLMDYLLFPLFFYWFFRRFFPDLRRVKVYRFSRAQADPPIEAKV
ncbi:hypothetical protein [Pseudomonas sp. SWRI154]|uniref:hypothetical protein n=1 Tax=Pseudomonas sp. SWRI154 TaxID=2745501 RepID=UPI0016476D64|nr:hypothetical protein [Pseudomonas sp. SWRI154]MBC3362645.1 hypothetical protein [Pseudomonas sp. SWRI154]